MDNHSPCHEPEPTSPYTPPEKEAPASPTSTTASTCMTSPCFVSHRDGRASSAGSSDFDELGVAQVQQLPAEHQMPHLDLAKTSQSFPYGGVLSPRQQSGRRYYGGYLQHRVPKAAGFLKGWKRKYFRLREHGLVCCLTQDVATPLFEVKFTDNSELSQDRESSSSTDLVLVLKHVEVMGHQTPSKTVEVPMILKAENEAEHAAWTECLQYMIEARKRALGGRNQSNNSSSKVPASQAVNNLVEVETFEAFSSKYMLMKEIGEGSFSIVHRAVNRMTGQVCAVKCCKISADLEEEERLLRTLSHPNVVGLEGVYERDKNLHYVVMDYLKDGDLCDLLIERQRLPESEARRIIRQVLEGLAYLHHRCVLHRDIKPENILIHGNIVKIADFGLAKQLAQPTAMLKHSCGTLEYAAPELLCGQPYGLKSDVFSLGVVLYVLLFGAFPFSVESAAALQCMDHFPAGVDVRDMSCLSRSNVQWRMVSPLAQDALLKMLEMDESERISAEDLLKHAWFHEIDDDMSEFAGCNGDTVEEFELTRVKDCETLGFAELLSRGFQVVKYGFKESTTPHSSSLSLNFMEECIVWTARKNPMLARVASNNNKAHRRAIPLRDIKEIREGHTTGAFLSCKQTKSLPPPDLCLSIVCPWRTLDLVVEAPSQREFMVRGLRQLLPSPPQ